MERKIVTISISDVDNMEVVKDIMVSVFDPHDEIEESTYHHRCPKEA